MAPTPFLDAMVVALRQDPTLLIPANEAAIGRLNEIDAVRRISGTAVVDGSVSDTLHDTRIRESLGPSVNAELAILDGGLRRAEAAIAALEVQQAGVDLRTDAIAAFAQVGSVYDALWQAQRSTTVFGQQERDAAADVRTLAAANRLGGVGRIDVERARAQEQQEQASLVMARTSEATQRATLNVLLDRAPDAAFVALPGLGLATPTFTRPEDAINATLAANPQALTDEISLATADATIDVDRAALRPTLGLGGTASYDFLNPALAAGGAAVGVGNQREQGALALALAIPLSDLGVTRRLVARAQSEASIASLTLAATQQQLASSAAGSFYTWEASGTNVTEAQRQVVFAQRVLRIDRAAFRIGAAPYYQIITDERDVLSAQISVVDEIEAQSNAVLALEEITATFPLDQTLGAAGIAPP